MKFSSSAVLVVISSLAVDTNGQESGVDALPEWLSTFNDTFTEVFATFTVIAGCASDVVALGDANPDLMEAYNSYFDTYDYQTTTVTDPSSRTDSATTTFSAESLSAYKSACDAVGETAGWIDVPTTIYSCVGDDYTFDVTESNWGMCYPTTDACKVYGEGYEEHVKLIADQWEKDGLTCTAEAAEDTTTATEPDVVATEVPVPAPTDSQAPPTVIDAPGAVADPAPPIDGKEDPIDSASSTTVFPIVGVVVATATAFVVALL